MQLFCSTSQASPLSHSLAFQVVDREHGPIWAVPEAFVYKKIHRNDLFITWNEISNKERGKKTWEQIPMLLETPKSTV